MTKVSIINREVFSRKFSTYLAAGLTGLALWFGGQEISSRRHNAELGRIAAIKKAEYDEIVKKNNIELQQKISTKRTEGLKTLDSALYDWRIDEAKRALANLRGEKFYSDKELAEMENRIFERTERGLYDKITSATVEEKERLVGQYLGIYPLGEHREDVSSELLYSRASQLSGSLNSGAEFDQTYQQIKNLNESLENLPGSNKLISLDNIVQLGKLYLEKKEKSPDGPNIGCRVKVIEDRAIKDWSVQYISERSKTVPYGSVGTVIDLWAPEDGIGRYTVRFPDVKETAWISNWAGRMKQYWDNGWNVAFYQRGELELLPLIDVVKKHKFQNELDRLMSKYPKKE